MTIMTRKQVGAWCKEMADQINSDPILLDIFTRTYCAKEEEHMALLKALRLAAGLTQQELSVATGIYPGKITDAERDIRALNEEQWERIQLVCDDRIKIFARDAGLTIKLG
jgi:hypothetical protein